MPGSKRGHIEQNDEGRKVKAEPKAEKPPQASHAEPPVPPDIGGTGIDNLSGHMKATDS